MIFEEKRIRSEKIYSGKILNLRRDTVTAVNGEAFREIIEHNGAVAIIPITADGNIVLVRQYRYAVGRAVLEIPAGKIEKGETSPIEVAARELKEETGYTADEMFEIGRIHPSVAYDEEVIHMFGARGLTPGEQDFDDDEELDVVEMPFDEFYDMVARGELTDCKTVAAAVFARGQMGV